MASTEPDPHIGALLAGRYRIVAKLGQGGMGAVYDAIQEDLDRRVAIKILRRDLLDDDELVARLRREAEATARLGHPHIVQLLDFARGACSSSRAVSLEARASATPC